MMSLITASFSSSSSRAASILSAGTPVSSARCRSWRSTCTSSTITGEACSKHESVFLCGCWGREQRPAAAARPDSRGTWRSGGAAVAATGAAAEQKKRPREERPARDSCTLAPGAARRERGGSGGGGGG
eukprot:COSAG04_NODE_2767_length_3616_cov_1.412568_1_plen_128_part_10